MNGAATCWEEVYRAQTARIAELEKENAELREDKARLDWLDDKGCWLTIPGSRNFLSGPSRFVIDRAMQEAKQ